MNIDIAQIFIAFIVLLFSLTVHEMAHAWTADRLGDRTARLLGRVSLNPLVHADPIGTFLFPLVAMFARLPFLIGWAKPVPVSVRNAADKQVRVEVIFFEQGEPNVSAPIASLLSQFKQINVLLAVFNMIPIPPLDGGNVLLGLLPRRIAVPFNSIRPFGFVLLYVLMFTGRLAYLVFPPAYFIYSWLP